MSDDAIREYDKNSDPDTLRKREIEVLRQGLQSEFWKWLEVQLAERLKTDILQLSNPETPEAQIGFLRGAINRGNEILRLPQLVVESYDREQEPEEDLEELDIPIRRASPIVEE